MLPEDGRRLHRMQVTIAAVPAIALENAGEVQAAVLLRLLAVVDALPIESEDSRQACTAALGPGLRPH